MSNVITRPEVFAQYIIDNNTTIRKTAEHFNISKSTVHNDVSKKLFYINISLFWDTKKILSNNFKMKYLRGGEATKQMYLLKKGLY